MVCCSLTYVLDEQRVSRDPLHGLEQEAGERHAFAAVVGGDLLLGGGDETRRGEKRRGQERKEREEEERRRKGRRGDMKPFSGRDTS